MVRRFFLGFFGLLLVPFLAAAQTPADRCPAGEPWTDEVVAKAIGLATDRLANLKATRALSNDDVCTMPEARLKRAMLRVEKPRPSAPGEWARFRARQQADENGRVQPDGLLRALEQRREILARGRPPGATTGAAAPAAGISSGAWNAIGPGNIGGRVRGLVIHPTQHNTIWIGSVSGGLWKTTDAGATWAPVNDFMGNLSISSIVISPTDANVMYAGTGEGFFNVDAVRGAGVFKSTDGGVTWAALASTNPALNSTWYYVNRLAIHPTNGNILLAATNNGVFRSTDAGATWSLRTSSGQRFADVDFDPLDGNKALAARGIGGGSSYYSVDAGNTWTPTNLNTAGRVEIAYSRQSGWVYASVDTNPLGVYNNTGSVYRSTDGGVNWTLQGSPVHLSVQGWYNNAIWVDPTSASHVIVGGLDLYRTVDGGVNWTKISSWFQTGSVHADHHMIVSSPGYNGTTNRTIYFGNDGGVYRATDINAVTSTSVGWTNLNNGLAITQFYGGAGHGGTNGRIIGGTQDNGSLRYTGIGSTWSNVFGGDGGAAAIDPNDGNYIYGEYTYLNIHRATNGVGPASYIWNGITDAADQLANFIAPFVLDPNTPTTLLAGGRSLWRSTNVKDLAPSWSVILAPTGDGGGNTYTSQIAVAQGNSSLIWVGKNNGTLWKTTDGTVAVPTWTQKGLGITPSRMVLSILVDKDNHNIVYAGFGGYSNQNLWKSTDGGTNWTSIGTGLPASPVRTIARHPAQANFLYVGTEVGIFASEDGGATWNTTNDGPANVSVDQLFWYDPTTLVAVTHGRGMYRTTVSASGNFTLTVSKAGTGSGPVSSNPAGISCGSVCSANFASGTSVTLTATPHSGSVFAGWSGACTGTSTCVVSMNAAKSVTATFNTSTSGNYTLTVAKAGTGSGPVSSSPSGISCGSVCSKSFASGTVVTLTATANSGSVFAGWSGACTGTSTCVVTMSQARSVTATFNTASGTGYTLTVSKSGTGSGPVTSSPSGISCGSACSKSFTAGTNVTLTATANAGSTFSGWSGACSGTNLTCVVTMNAAKNVTATFNTAAVTSYTLTVSKTGTGTGAVASSPSGINCGATCSAAFAAGSNVTLTATPSFGSGFVGWTGSCTGSGFTCIVPMTSAKSVTANFATGFNYTTLGVAKSGAGSGVVTSSPAAINCGAVCSGSFVVGSTVTLTAAALSGSTFAGWSGACTGTALTCVVNLSAAANVTAAFNVATVSNYALTITKAGTGSGPVTSNPAGISCGSTCNASFASGTVVTLTATPNSGSVFAGWSGACTGTSSTCVVSMNAAKSVTATFNTGYTLTVTKAGTGSGPVSSSPAGISCGSACAAGFAAGTSVTLTATPNAGSTFGGWSGACTGTASTCVVSMTAAKNVTATFNAGYALSVSKSGSGSGGVASNPAGIDCGATCTASFASGTNVTLTASPNGASLFAGWSGACSGTASTCVLSMTAARSVTATFNTAPTGPTLAEALDNNGLVWNTSGSGLWTGQTAVSYDGVDAARSGPLLDGQVSILSTTVVGPAVLSYRWKVSSETSFDYLTFYFNGTAQVGAISGEVNWQLQAWSLPPGTHTVEWRYSKDGSVAGGSDAGWLDQVTLVPTYQLAVTKAGTGSGSVSSSPAGISCGATCNLYFTEGTSVTLTATPDSGSHLAAWSGACTGSAATCVVSMTQARSVTATFNSGPSLADSLDNNVLVFASSGSALWSPQTAVTADGVDAAQSGAILDSQQSSVSTTVVGPGTLSYYWKVSSELGYDYLTFYYDGFAQEGLISGEVGFIYQGWSIPAGTHVIEWRYSKDSSVSLGSDRGWLDLVTWTPSATPAGATPKRSHAPKPAPAVPKKN